MWNSHGRGLDECTLFLQAEQSIMSWHSEQYDEAWKLCAATRTYSVHSLEAVIVILCRIFCPILLESVQ